MGEFGELSTLHLWKPNKNMWLPDHRESVTNYLSQGKKIREMFYPDCHCIYKGLSIWRYSVNKRITILLFLRERKAISQISAGFSSSLAVSIVMTLFWHGGKRTANSRRTHSTVF